jgi:beta-phosphoglucomutase family hydrolase
VAELPDTVQSKAVWSYATYETPLVPGGKNRGGGPMRQGKQDQIGAFQEKHSVSPGEYEAWLFDLDGVITDTASVHAAAWKRTFDEYLKVVSERGESSCEPFKEDPDYYWYVDGKPRYAGVDSFLRSRGIIVEWGDPNDPPSRETVCGIGNRKNALFNEVLRLRGVEVFESSVALVQELRTRDRRVAVVTSSKNCDAVLGAAGIQNLFEARVDGNVAAEKKLTGKPAPETYEEAARMLGTLPERAVVIEDAISGVQAGRTGGFGLVIGVARGDDPGVLRQNGADIVVRDLADLSLL